MRRPRRSILTPRRRRRRPQNRILRTIQRRLLTAQRTLRAPRHRSKPSLIRQRVAPRAGAKVRQSGGRGGAVDGVEHGRVLRGIGPGRLDGEQDRGEGGELRAGYGGWGGVEFGEDRGSVGWVRGMGDSLTRLTGARLTGRRPW